MFNKRVFATLAAVALIQPVFAHKDMSTGSNDKVCAPIVNACLDAGYSNHDSEGKRFWLDCMKPLLLNKKVTSVTVDAKEVKSCRAAKITELKHELAELRAVK